MAEWVILDAGKIYESTPDMPQIPNRDELEMRFAAVIAAATARQKERLRRAMGHPPDPANIPEELWHEIEEEQAAATGLLLAIIFLTSGDQLDRLMRQGPQRINPPPINGAAMSEVAHDWGRRRSAELAQMMRETTQKRLRLAHQQGDVEKALFDISSEQRANMVALTEVTEATTQGELQIEGYLDAHSGWTSLKEWRHRAPWREGHPCPEICLPLVGTTQNQWPTVHPERPQVWAGPPGHPRCDCNVRYHFLTKAEAALLATTFPDPLNLPTVEQQLAAIRRSAA